MESRYYIHIHLLAANGANRLEEHSELSKLWVSFLFWLLPAAFVWLSLLGIDYTLHIPLIVGIPTSLLVYLYVGDYRMRYAVFQPIAG